jgi:hypothetical protein
VKEPRRLREESKSPIERVLLDTAASYRRPAATRAKTLAALGLAGSAALSAGAARGAWATIAAKVGGAKALVAIAALGATVTVPAVYYGVRSRTAPALATGTASPGGARFSNVSAPSPVPSQATSPLPPSVAVPDPVDTSREASLHAANERVTTARGSRVAAANRARAPRNDPQPVATSAPPSASASELTAEVTAIEAARARLAKGDAAASLALLDEYAAAFPEGHLRPEAMVLRIDALAKTGRSTEAKKIAQTFLQRYPKSVLAARVRGHLSD